MDKKVILFTTPQCSWCQTAKRFLKEKKVHFKEVDVSRDERAAKDMVRRTGQQGVPVILVNNHPVVGFDQSKLKRLLNLR